MDDPGICILRDAWLKFEQNQPQEMQEIHRRYLREIKNDAEEKWTNRERSFLDLRVLQEWYDKDWHTKTRESLYEDLCTKFESKKFIKSRDQMFEGILGSQDCISDYFTGVKAHNLQHRQL